MEVQTPILFLKEFKAIPNALLRLLGFPSVSYSDTEPYSLNAIVTYLFGFNVFQARVNFAYIYIFFWQKVFFSTVNLLSCH